MKRLLSSTAIAALLLCGAPAWGQSVTWDFEDATDQGFGTGFGNDASASFPIVNIGGSNRSLQTPAAQPVYSERRRQEGGSRQDLESA